MGQQVVDGDVFPGSRAVLDVSADGILDVQPALRLQDKDRHGGELLGDGTQAEPGPGRIGDARLTVRGTVSSAEKHLAILGDQDGTTEGLVHRHAAEDLVQLCDPVRTEAKGSGLSCAGREEQQAQRQQER